MLTYRRIVFCLVRRFHRCAKRYDFMNLGGKKDDKRAVELHGSQHFIPSGIRSSLGRFQGLSPHLVNIQSYYSLHTWESLK